MNCSLVGSCCRGALHKSKGVLRWELPPNYLQDRGRKNSLRILEARPFLDLTLRQYGQVEGDLVKLTALNASYD